MKFLSIFLILFLLLLNTKSYCTHITGGTISYSYLHQDTFLIKLVLFRDCNGQAPFDNPAIIGLFNSNNILIRTINIVPTIENAVDTFDQCSPWPNILCVEKDFYESKIYLPYISGGYKILYQRCCRDEGIKDLCNPDTSGISLLCFINDSLLVHHHSSIEFQFVPSRALCLYDSAKFFVNAITPDADSVSYKLTTAIDGASAPNPMPQPPAFYNFHSVCYNNNYSFKKPFSLSSISTINSLTGEMLIVPSKLGLFLVAVNAYEYQQGILIDSNRIEFQMWVGEFPVGIADKINDGKFFISPNPTDGNFTISSSITIQQIEVINLLGEKIFTAESNSQSQTLHLTSLSNGVYFIRIKTASGIVMKKIVVE